MLKEIEQSMSNSSLAMEDLQKFIASMPSLEEGELPEAKREEGPSCDGQSASCPLPLFGNLINYMKGSLVAMQSFASLSRDAFKDAELGEYYYEIICAEFEKTMSLLNCYCDYLQLNKPVKAKGTLRMLIEEVLKERERQLKEKDITIISKQLEENLPENLMPDAPLRYALDTIIRYNLLTMPHHSSLGFLTKLYDHTEGNGQEQNGLEKDGEYVEILIVSSYPGKTKGFPAGGSTDSHGTEADLILALVKEMIRKNHGGMRVKCYEQEAMTFISLILPADRRKVVQFPPCKPLEQKRHRSDESDGMRGLRSGGQHGRFQWQ